MRSKHLAVFLALCMMAGLATVAAAQPVLRVVVVQTDDPEGYVKELEKGRAMVKRLQGSAVIRVWRARFAGEDAGAVVASVEYPSMEAMVRDDIKAGADPEWSAWLKALDKKRKIVSDSLFTELK